MSRLSRPIILGLLFLSGFTGLVLALVWWKRLAPLVGATGPAQAMLLAAAFGALGAGAWGFGRLADRVKRPLVLFGLLSLGVGASALLAGRMLDLTAVALVLPALLLGGTGPALARAFAKPAPATAVTVHALGAAVGCLFAATTLIPGDALRATEGKAAVLGLFLGAVALVLGWRSTPGPDAMPAEPSPREARAVFLGLGLVGASAVLYASTWVRLLSIAAGSTPFILPSLILGFGLGAAWLSRREADALAGFSRLQVLVAGTVCLGLPFYGRFPYLFLNLHAALKKSPATWPLHQLIAFGFCFAAVAGPSFFLGASVCAAARAAPRHVASGLAIGSGLGLLGSLALGPEGSLAAGLALSVAAAGVGAWACAAWTRLWPIGAALALVIASVISALGWPAVAAASGRFPEWQRTFDGFDAFRAEVAARGPVTFHGEDGVASVVVQEAGPRRTLRVNGSLAANTGSALDAQILTGHLGVIIHPGEVKRVLLVGLGPGITAGALLSHPIDALDVVEPSPAVAAAARRFADDNGQALDDPRCTVHVADAAAFLRRSQDRWDLIVTTPQDPGLFTRDFLQAASAHLNPGGQFVQQFRVAESSEALVRLVVRTFRDTFAHGTSWLGTQDLVLVGAALPQGFDPATLAARMMGPLAAQDLRRAHAPDFPTLLARQVHSDEGQRQLAGTGAINTDDHNRLAAESPGAAYASEPVDFHDERKARDRGARLELSKWTRSQPLTADEAQHVHQAFASVHPPGDALVRSAAERWLALDPDSEAAALAVAKAAFAQRDVAGALALLDPRIAQGARTPALVAVWLDARARQMRRASAPYHPIDLGPARAIARETLAAHPGDAALTKALEDAR